jgi:flagellar hook-associated protein 3 FlgL
MADALESGDQDADRRRAHAARRRRGRLQATVGDVGARQNHADALTTGLAALSDTLTRQQSDLGEVDAEEAITEMLSRQTAYQAAMLASSKVMGVSLADYLR